MRKPFVSQVTMAVALLFLSLAKADAATLIGYWPFEEDSGTTVSDYSSFENDGELTGATRSEGKVGRGLNFTGQGGVTVPHSPSLDPPGGLTMEAWIKPTGPFADFQTIFFKTNPTTREFLHFQTTTRLHIGINTDPFTWTTPTDVVTPGVWQHVAWTYDEAFHRIYVDGVGVFSTPFTQPFTPNAEPLLIGGHPTIPNARFVGMIDEARFYRGALTQDDIIRDMNAPVVPEPSSFWLLGSGLLGLAGWRRRRI